MTQLDKDLNAFLVETFGDTHNVVIHGAHGYHHLASRGCMILRYLTVK